MTESQLWHAIEDVRLLARQHVRTTRDGRVLSGRVNPVLEAIREAALGALERIQDGLPLISCRGVASRLPAGRPGPLQRSGSRPPATAGAGRSLIAPSLTPRWSNPVGFFY
jgi:hypothetical protein